MHKRKWLRHVQSFSSWGPPERWRSFEKQGLQESLDIDYADFKFEKGTNLLRRYNTKAAMPAKMRIKAAAITKKIESL